MTRNLFGLRKGWRTPMQGWMRGRGMTLCTPHPLPRQRREGCCVIGRSATSMDGSSRCHTGQASGVGVSYSSMLMLMLASRCVVKVEDGRWKAGPLARDASFFLRIATDRPHCHPLLRAQPPVICRWVGTTGNVAVQETPLVGRERDLASWPVCLLAEWSYE